MAKVSLIVLALALSGCLYIRGGEVRTVAPNQHSVRCIVDESYCYDIARDTCHGDFMIIKRDHMQFVVSCKH